MTSKRITVTLDRGARDRLAKLSKPGETEYAALNRLVDAMLQDPVTSKAPEIDLSPILDKLNAITQPAHEFPSDKAGRHAIAQVGSILQAISGLSDQIEQLSGDVRQVVSNGNRSLDLVSRALR